MKSTVKVVGDIQLPLITGEYSMLPFQMNDVSTLPLVFQEIASKMLTMANIPLEGIAFLTVHGKRLLSNQTLRRGGPHTDGNYDKSTMDWGGGWKVGENGPAVDTPEHARLYNTEGGGIIMASNYEACHGWIGEYDGLPGVGGDCSKIVLPEPTLQLQRNTVYYGNNHFIHESLPMKDDVHRVFARITLPATNLFN